MFDEMARRPVPIYRRGNRPLDPPLIGGGQGRTPQENEDTGVWFSLFMLMVVLAILACVFGLAGGEQ